MKDKALDKIEFIKKRIVSEKGWFVPALHEKYVEKKIAQGKH